MVDAEISGSTVKILANIANLTIKSEREELIASQLKEWIENANKLNEKMSQIQYVNVTPLTIISL